MNDTAEYDEDLNLVTPIRTRRREEMEMDITPMIDITFLLLIFFIVASRMDIDTSVRLPSAYTGTAVSTRNSVVITVARQPNGAARVYKGDGMVTETQIDETERALQANEIVNYVQAGLLENVTATSVLIKAERGVKHREVSHVAQAVGAVDLVHQRNIELHIAVLETQ